MKWDFRCKSKYEIHECKTVKNTNEKMKLRVKKINLREIIERKKKKKKEKKRREKERKGKKRKTEIKWMKEKVRKVI